MVHNFEHPNNLEVVYSKYLSDNKSLAVLLLDEGVNYATLSVFVEGISENLPEDQFVVKHYAENEGLAFISRYDDKFEDTGVRVAFGFITDAPVWRRKHQHV